MSHGNATQLTKGRKHAQSFAGPQPEQPKSVRERYNKSSFVGSQRPASARDAAALNRQKTNKSANTWQTQEDEKNARIAKLKESRQRYGRKSRPATAQLKKGQPTVSEAELNQIVARGWKDAEKLKAQKEEKTKRNNSKPKKRAHVKSQNTIQEEAALSQIVSKAWTTYEKKKEHTKKPKVNNFDGHHHPKPVKKARVKSQNTLIEEAQLQQIVGKAWKNVEKTKAKPKPSPQKAKRHVHIKSQNTLMEEA